jgi:hypothetical protein
MLSPSSMLSPLSMSSTFLISGSKLKQGQILDRVSVCQQEFGNPNTLLTYDFKQIIFDGFLGLFFEDLGILFLEKNDQKSFELENYIFLQRCVKFRDPKPHSWTLFSTKLLIERAQSWPIFQFLTLARSW